MKGLKAEKKFFIFQHFSFYEIFMLSRVEHNFFHNLVASFIFSFVICSSDALFVLALETMVLFASMLYVPFMLLSILML